MATTEDDVLYPAIRVAFSANQFCTNRDDPCWDSVYCEHSTEEHGWEDEVGYPCHPDRFDVEDGITAVDKALEYLRDNGATEVSAAPYTAVSGEGEWYYTYDEQPYLVSEYDAYERSFHLTGFTPTEQRAIWRRFHEEG